MTTSNADAARCAFVTPVASVAFVQGFEVLTSSSLALAHLPERVLVSPFGDVSPQSEHEQRPQPGMILRCCT